MQHAEQIDAENPLPGFRRGQGIAAADFQHTAHAAFLYGVHAGGPLYGLRYLRCHRITDDGNLTAQRPRCVERQRHIGRLPGQVGQHRRQRPHRIRHPVRVGGEADRQWFAKSAGRR